MGLIAVLLALYYGLDLVLIPTEAFVRRPGIWLDSISHFHGTISPAPPFAFNLLAKRRANKDKLLDLSSWRYAWVGAEPIFPSQLSVFEDVYRSSALSANVLQGAYGLAESVVVVSCGAAGQKRLVLDLDLDELRQTGKVLPTRFGKTVQFVGCGSPNRNMEVRIVDENGSDTESNSQGRILIRGPSVTRGYLNDPDPRNTASWLDTGDIGFFFDKQLFISGRSKDLIKRGGVGIAPHEIEWIVEQTLGLRTGRAVALSYLNPICANEEIIVLVESRTLEQGALENVVAEVSRYAGVQLDTIRCVGLGGIPRTASGKLCRGLARELFLCGEYDRTRRRENVAVGN
jgi:acyl-CoA synthetase (AMP-forming)/AMP-acid ligase II